MHHPGSETGTTEQFSLEKSLISGALKPVIRAQPGQAGTVEHGANDSRAAKSKLGKK